MFPRVKNLYMQLQKTYVNQILKSNANKFYKWQL